MVKQSMTRERAYEVGLGELWDANEASIREDEKPENQPEMYGQVNEADYPEILLDPDDDDDDELEVRGIYDPITMSDDAIPDPVEDAYWDERLAEQKAREMGG